MTEAKIILKKQLLDACRKHQSNTIANLKREMDEHQQMANEYGPPKDRYDAFRSQMLRRRDIFAEQLQKANLEMITLEKIKAEELKNKVELGSVVVTNTQKLFIAISLGKVTVDNETFYVISPAVPIFKVLKDLKAGDEAVFNGNKILIKDVF